jgi:hypothetical protein
MLKLNRVFKSEKGAVQSMPLLLIVFAVGLISFLLIASVAPFKGIFNNIYPKPASFAATDCQGADLDNNGKVDIFDYNILIGNFGKSGVGASGGDINISGSVDIFDYNSVVGNFGKTGCITSSPTPSPSPVANGMAQICGTQICINGTPFRIHGATAYGQYSNAQNEMNLASQGNINTLEIVEFEDNYHNLSSLTSASTWSKVDNFIAVASQNHKHVILHLASFGQALQASGQNYLDINLWKPFFDFVTNRTNSVTGVKYINDPTIVMIEIWGEIPQSTGDAAFFHNALSYLRSKDPNHIISAGGLSYIDYNSGIDWNTIMSEPLNQVCAVEINSSGDRNISVPNVTNLCKNLGKPWFLAAWSSCYQAGGGDLTNQPSIQGMTDHALDMYTIEKGTSPAAMPAIGADFWNLASAAPNPGTCDLSPQFPTIWSIIQNN